MTRPKAGSGEPHRTPVRCPEFCYCASVVTSNSSARETHRDLIFWGLTDGFRRAPHRVQGPCGEGGCRPQSCSNQNISLDYVEANRWDTDVPVFDVTKNNSLIFTYDRVYRNRMLMDGKDVFVHSNGLLDPLASRRVDGEYHYLGPTLGAPGVWFEEFYARCASPQPRPKSLFKGTPPVFQELTTVPNPCTQFQVVAVVGNHKHSP